MNWKHISATVGGCLAATLGLILWDVFLAIDEIPHNTISELLRDAALRHWWIPMAWGFLGGHFWLNADPAKRPAWVKKPGLPVFGGATFALDVGIGFLLVQQNLVVPVWFSGLLFMLVGPVLGWWFWPQRRRKRES